MRADAVVSSPEPKALATARALGRPVEVDERLREHDRGGVPLRSRAWLEAALAEAFARPHAVVLGTESLAAAHARFAAGVAAARERHPGRLAVVAHGTVIALYVARATGADALTLWRGLGLPDVVELEEEGAGVSPPRA